MKLTPTQERRISSFLREAATRFDTLQPGDRAERLADVKRRLQQELKQYDNGPLEDKALDAVLARCRQGLSTRESADGAAAAVEHSPEPKSVPRQSPPAHGSSPLGAPDRIWLGVCLALSQRFNADPFLFRLAFVLAGLITGPFAILVYAGAYFEAYYTSREEDPPPIDYGKLFRRVAGTGVGLVSLYGLTRLCVYGIGFGYEQATGDPLQLGTWAWLEPHRDDWLFWMLFFSLPLALLSGLPLHNDWDYTWKRIVQAGAALYAVVLSASIASVLVAALLALVEKYAA